MVIPVDKWCMRNEILRVVLFLAVAGCGRLGGLKVPGKDSGTGVPAVATVEERDAQTQQQAMGMDAPARPHDVAVMRPGFNPTTKVTFRGNLYPGEVHQWDVSSPAATSNCSFSVDIIDNSGAAVYMPVYFVRESAPSDLSGRWTYHAEVGGNHLAGNDVFELLEGILTFNGEGKLVEANQSTTGIPLKNGDTQTILLDFGAGLSQGGTGDDAVTSMKRETFMTSIVLQPDP